MPPDDVRVCSGKHSKVLCLTEEEAEAAATSLQALVHYHHLYQRWWSDSTLVPAAAANGAASEETRPRGELDALASALLSERHAAFQAAQRSVGQIQERLAAMVLKHSRAQAGQLRSGENEADGEPSDRRGSADAEQR